MSTIDEIKQRLDVVDTVSAYVRLEKAGRNFKALCPFHEEKTPSFFVFPDRQSWRCFGCGQGGDLFSFVMKKEGLDFSDALKMLAEKAGVSIERRKRVAEREQTRDFYRINEEAARYYHELLLNSDVAEPARKYVESRGLSRKAVDAFDLGFSAGDGLKKHLIGLGCAEKDLLALGLLGEKDGRTYDYFRRRLMFPIRDAKGQVVGFGARALDDALPKYLNSRQTAIFDKSGVLYGVDRARSSIKEGKPAVIVEGYMDVIMAHQHGFDNVVGSMGTALTEKQMRILRGMTRSLAFALDPDAAGDVATMRGIEVARRSLERRALEMPTILGGTSTLKAEIKIIGLPRGSDPDAVIREDPQEWQRLVDEALPLMEHLISVAAARLDVSRPEGKELASEQLLPLIAEMESDLEREYYLGKLAALLNVSERTLLGKVADMRGTRREKTARMASKPSSSVHHGDPLEEYCLALLLQHSRLVEKAEGLRPEHFERSENREVFAALLEASEAGDVSRMIDIDLQGHLNELSERPLPPADDIVLEKGLAQCLQLLEERLLKLQDEFITSESVSVLSDGEELEPERLASLQKKSEEINAELVKKMRERTGLSLHGREDR